MVRAPAKLLIILLMAVGSLAMWIVTPVGWIYLVSQLAESSQVKMWHVALVLTGIPVTMIVIGKLLGRLNHLYLRMSGQEVDMRVTPPERRSFRGARDERQPRTMLDVVMVASVATALVAMGVWFLFFAEGGGLPGS
jgi:hypothetical protein